MNLLCGYELGVCMNSGVCLLCEFGVCMYYVNLVCGSGHACELAISCVYYVNLLSSVAIIRCVSYVNLLS
jgi:hypothetical protein